MEGTFRSIIVSGNVGVGSSTLAKNLAKELGWKYISAGDISRQYHLEHNIPLWDKAAVPEGFERYLDNKISEIVKNESGYVIDSHYASWFARHQETIYRILLTCDLKAVQARIAGRRHTHEEKPEEVIERMKQLKDKFRLLYSQDNYEDPKYFHLVIDTTNSTQEETLQQALKNFNLAKKNWC